MKIEDFYTRKDSNEGVKVPLEDLEGNATEHWLLVRSSDSDSFKKAILVNRRAALEIFKIKDLVKRDEIIQDNNIKMISSLIAGWSFPKKLTSKSTFELLKEAPQILEIVNILSGDRAEYFRKKQASLNSGPVKTSSSKKGAKARKRN